MPRSTGVPSVGVLPSWLENFMIVPLFSPLGICNQAGGERRQRDAGLPHGKSSSFSLTNSKFFFCSQADRRSCDPGGKPRAKSWENVCLKPTFRRRVDGKKDF